MEPFWKTLLIALVVLISFHFTGGESLRLDIRDAPVTDHSRTIDVPPTWGIPGEIVLDIPGEVLLVPFFEYAGSSFALARKNRSMPDMELLLVSSSSERTLVPDISICAKALKESRGTDIILKDVNGAVYGMPFHSRWGDARSLTPSDIILTGIKGGMSLADITGDDICDLIHLSVNGTSIELIEGPFPSASGRSVLNLPLPVTEIRTGFDLDGDGVSEIALWNGESTEPTILIYHGVTISPMAMIASETGIDGIFHGDLDGNGIDDLILRRSSSLDILFGEDIGFDTDLNNDTYVLRGEPGLDLEGDLNIALKDLDGDGIDDIIIGIPDHDDGKGRLLIKYGGSIRESKNQWLIPDAEFVGSAGSDSLGRSIYICGDHNGDLLADLFLGMGNDLVELQRERNIVPFLIRSVSFADPVSFEERITAEYGGITGVICTASGGSLNRSDILKAEFETERNGISTESWIYLRETGNATGEYRGVLGLTGGSVPGRSIGVVPDDVVKISVSGQKGEDLLISGVAGQEDRPNFIEGPEQLTIMEDSRLDIVLKAVDPDGDPIEFIIEDQPDWLTDVKRSIFKGVHVLELGGTPDNGDVGWNNFTVHAMSNNTGTMMRISILVVNTDPQILPVDVPTGATEGLFYRARFEMIESGGNATLSLSSRGPFEEHFLEISSDGSIQGVPENIHVGKWEFELVADDNNGGTYHHNWSVEVINLDPVMGDLRIINGEGKEVEAIIEMDEYQIMIPATGRGDGLTFYTIYSGYGQSLLDRSNGTIVIPAGTLYSGPEIEFSVMVEDGHGGIAKKNFSVSIINRPPRLLNADELPNTLVAGKRYEIDLITDHERDTPDGSGGLWISVGSESGIMESMNISHDGLFVVYPLNMDTSSNEILITIGDWREGDHSIWTWSFDVEENPDIRDPNPDNIRMIGRKGNDLHMRIKEMSDHQNLSMRILVIDRSDITLMNIPLEVPFEGTMELDTEGFPDDIVIVSVLTVGDGRFRREFNRTMEVNLKEIRDMNSDKSSPSAMILFSAMVIMIVAVIIVMLFVERTSFALQMALLKGGKLRRDEVVSTIQDDPGLRFEDLRKRSSIPTVDLVSTIDRLEREGMVRSVNDGMKVRFWPMMGSFVDGPLVLSRYQKRIVNALRKGKKMTFDELVRITGIPSRKLEKELSMMDLKGIISVIERKNEKLHYLSSIQRSRIEKILK